MSLPNDIDFQFLRRKHGWSEARLYIDDYCEEFTLTHVFNEPLKALLSATVYLANNSDKANFSWFDEPGQYNWQFTEVKTEHHLLDVLIYSYRGIVGFGEDRNCDREIHRTISFKVARDFWIALVTSEAEKISRLLSYRHYKIARAPQDFPWQELKELKKYLKMK